MDMIVKRIQDVS